MYHFIYRVEDCEDLNGPYNNPHDFSFSYSHKNVNHPTLSHDFPDKLSSSILNYKCGFKNLSQMKSWFNLDEMKEILDHPQMRVVKMKVKKFLYGKSKKQVFFLEDSVMERKVIPDEEIIKFYETKS